MTERKVSITVHDMERLQTFIDIQKGPQAPPHFERLAKKLREAVITDPKRIPGNVVTMNSIVPVKDVDTGERHTFILTFPDRAGPAGKTVSILAPIGIALIGYREGDILEWDMPSGKVRIQIDEITYQPERLGNYNL